MHEHVELVGGPIDGIQLYLDVDNWPEGTMYVCSEFGWWSHAYRRSDKVLVRGGQVFTVLDYVGIELARKEEI